MCYAISAYCSFLFKGRVTSRRGCCMVLGQQALSRPWSDWLNNRVSFVKTGESSISRARDFCSPSFSRTGQGLLSTPGQCDILAPHVQLRQLLRNMQSCSYQGEPSPLALELKKGPRPPPLKSFQKMRWAGMRPAS